MTSIGPDALVDLGGLTLSPGFVDTHVHITGDGKPNTPVTIGQFPGARLAAQAAHKLDETGTSIRSPVETVRAVGKIF